MQFIKKTSLRSNILGLLIKLALAFIVILGIITKLALVSLIILSVIFLLNKIDFPAPKKEIEKIIPNENFKIVK